VLLFQQNKEREMQIGQLNQILGDLFRQEREGKLPPEACFDLQEATAEIESQLYIHTRGTYNCRIYYDCTAVPPAVKKILLELQEKLQFKQKAANAG
jgi:hypothetical protein